MELSWNLCPYCGTPAPGMRRENMTMDDVTRPMPLDDEEPLPEEPMMADESLPEEPLNDNGDQAN
jgi:hypothetical protein